MSDFPKGGDIQATRDWLDKEGFSGKFLNWEADAILGLVEKTDVIRLVGDEVEGLKLWGFLNTARQTPARQTQGKLFNSLISSILCFHYVLLHYYFFLFLTK